jgi:hypothetical protein
MSIQIFLLMIINFSLAAYIFKLIRDKKQSQIKYKCELEALSKDRLEYIHTSLFEISRATLHNQVELSEAVVRLKKLMDMIKVPKAIEENMQPIQRMYKEISHMPFLDERSKLTSAQLEVQDQERFNIEKKYLESIKLCCKKLRDFYETI